MTYILDTSPQGTPEWYAIRAGKVTGSRADCVLAKGKNGEAATRRNYRVQLVTERLTGKSQDEGGYQSPDILWGKEQEPFARAAYEALTGALVEQVGFIHLPDLAVGCSVDGLVQDGDERGFLEAKCPKSATHIGYLLANRIPPEYVPQITNNLYVTGCAFVDFVSYDPRLPENLQLLHVRAYRDEFKAELAAYDGEVRRFLDEVGALEDQLRKRAA